LVCLAPSFSQALTYSVATDKATYRPGETLLVSVTASNPSASPITLNFSSASQAIYGVDAYTPDWSSATVLTNRTIPANGSYTWTFTHDWGNYLIPLGPHNLSGSVVGYGSAAAPSAFIVTAPTYPTAKFLLDFNSPTLPASGSDSVSEFWQYGITFSSIRNDGWSAPRRYRKSGGDPNDGYIGINSTTYPPGFDIIADFAMPVSSLTVDVTTATDTSITLLAKDINGRILATTTSSPVSAFGEFVPLSITSPNDTPIASVEWWPSKANATVQLDNLWITPDTNASFIPEPSATAAFVAALACLTSTSRRRLRIV
jgi:hypothetical protein